MGDRDECSNEAEPEHTCPFAEEVNGDYERMCECCAECTEACAESI
ncbi:hypothetical protein LCGC14_2493840 [marine sediment metagenome]|uniref:Uncharacterized protein n=1 Tax=marine sediment metagenome TaxID=412755 RepID=A0A0F9BRV6_9ZZZZ